MKCVSVKNGSEIRRVQDSFADKLVSNGWEFRSKTDWRKAGKPMNQADYPAQQVKRTNKVKKAKKTAEANPEAVDKIDALIEKK